MRIIKGFNREVIVDLISGVTGRKPLEFQIDEPPTTYVRMPEGEFSIRILSPAPLEVRVELDNVKLLETGIDRGVHTLARTDQDLPFFFGNPDSPAYKRCLEAARAANNEAGIPPTGVSAEVGNHPAKEINSSLPPENNPLRIIAVREGLLVVSVRFVRGRPLDGPHLPPDCADHLFFQLNPPGKHEKALAGLLAHVVSPPSAEDLIDELLAPDGTPKRGPIVKRHCVTCRGNLPGDNHNSRPGLLGR